MQIFNMPPILDMSHNQSEVIFLYKCSFLFIVWESVSVTQNR